jgi:hypothetical protein
MSEHQIPPYFGHHSCARAARWRFLSRAPPPRPPPRPPSAPPSALTNAYLQRTTSWVALLKAHAELGALKVLHDDGRGGAALEGATRSARVRVGIITPAAHCIYHTLWRMVRLLTLSSYRCGRGLRTPNTSSSGCSSSRSRTRPDGCGVKSVRCAPSSDFEIARRSIPPEPKIYYLHGDLYVVKYALLKLILYQ